jgi:hypothetical protein
MMKKKRKRSCPSLRFPLADGSVTIRTECVDIDVGHISHITTAMGLMKCHPRIAVLRRVHEGDDATDLPWHLHDHHDSLLAVIAAVHSKSHTARHA